MVVILFIFYQLFMLLKYSSSFTEVKINLVQNLIKKKLVEQVCLLSTADEMRVISVQYQIYPGVSTDVQHWYATCQVKNL